MPDELLEFQKWIGGTSGSTGHTMGLNGYQGVWQLDLAEGHLWPKNLVQIGNLGRAFWHAEIEQGHSVCRVWVEEIEDLTAEYVLPSIAVFLDALAEFFEADDLESYETQYRLGEATYPDNPRHPGLDPERHYVNCPKWPETRPEMAWPDHWIARD